MTTRSYILTLLALALFTAATGCGKQSRANRHLERADRFHQAGEYDKARIEYLNVIRLEPTNQVAVARLAQIHYDRGELSSAVPLLLRARELSPENLEVRRRLGQVFVQAGKLDEARAEAEAILIQNPADEDGILILSRTARDTNELAQVRVRLEELRGRTGDSSTLQLALGNLAMRMGDRAAAETSFRQALAFDPQSSRAKLALGSFYWTQGKTNEAGALLQAAAQEAKPASPEVIRWAQYNLQTGAREEAKRILEGAANAEPANASVGVMLGELALAENNLVECSNRVTRVLRQDPANYDAMLLQARLLRGHGDHTKSIEVLQRAQGLYPTSPQLAFELSISHVANGNPAEAIQRLEATLDLDPQYPEASLLLAELQLARGDPASAVSTLRNLLNERPDIPRTLLALANAYKAQGRLDEALNAADSYLRIVTNDASGALTKGLILRQQEKPGDARIAFEQARQLAPTSEAVLYQLVELDLLDQQYDDALRRVRLAIEQAPKSPGATYLFARVYLAQNKVDEAEAALNQTIELGPNFSLAYSMLLEIYAKRGDHAAALAKLDTFLEQRPRNLGALMTKGMLHDRLGDYPAAAAAYRAILNVNSNSVLALNNLAYLYSEHLDDVDQARPLAVRARELAPTDPGIADTLGWVHYHRGDYPEALSLFLESAARLPAEPEVQLHLGLTHYMMGHEEPARVALEAALNSPPDASWRGLAEQRLALLNLDSASPDPSGVAQLENAIKSNPADPVALLRLASIKESQGDIDRAIQLCLQAIKASPDALAPNLKLAQLYATRPADQSKALDQARKARDLAPTDPVATLTLGRIAFNSGDHAWALSLIEQGASRITNQPTLFYDLAWARYSVGRVDDAIKSMKQAQALGLDPRLNDPASRFVELVAAHEDPAEAGNLYTRAQQILQADPTFAPALMIIAIVDQQNNRIIPSRNAAEQVLTQYPGFNPAHRLLATLYLADPPDNSKAYDHAVKARTAYPSDPIVAKALGIAYHHRNEHRRTIDLLQEASVKQPNDPEILLYLGMSYFNLQQFPAARTALDQVVKLQPTGPITREAERVLAEIP